jgi:uncharacterized protein YqeY
MSLRSALDQALRPAMKARDAAAVAAVRSALAAIANAEAVDVPQPEPAAGGRIAGAALGLGAAEAERRELSEADIAGIVGTEITEREQAAGQYAAAGRDERAQRLRAEAAALRAVLDGGPAQ